MERVEDAIRALRATDLVRDATEQHWKLFRRTDWTIDEYVAAMDEVLYRVRGMRSRIREQPMAYFYKAMERQVGLGRSGGDAPRTVAPARSSERGAARAARPDRDTGW